MRMLEKIKMRISVAAFVLNAISMIERGVLATLQSPLVLVFPPRRKLNYTISKTVQQTRTDAASVWSVGLSVLPGLFLYLADFPALDCTVGVRRVQR